MTDRRLLTDRRISAFPEKTGGYALARYYLLPVLIWSLLIGLSLFFFAEGSARG